jgi:tetratricopeptide (TPR) repeat protein
MMRRAGLFLGLLAAAHLAQGQFSRELIWLRRGNSAYEAGSFSESERYYRDALAKQPNSYTGVYNLGDALYRQQRWQEAESQFQTAASLAASPGTRAQASYNLGNARLKQGNAEGAIAAYRDALRLDPSNADARYNLSYALRQLRQEQENQSQDQQQKQQQSQQQEQEQQQSQPPKEPSNPNQPPRADAPRQQMTKQEIDRMLEAIQYQEDRRREDMSKLQVRPRGRHVKDW